MDPNNEPWIPRPYEANPPQQQSPGPAAGQPQPMIPPQPPTQPYQPQQPQQQGQMLFPSNQYAHSKELPPLGGASAGKIEKVHASRKIGVWAILVALVIVPALIIGVVTVVKLSGDSTKPKPIAGLTYDDAALQALGASPTDGQAASLDKTSAFYTVLRKAAQEQVVQTTSDVYYTAGQSTPRGQEYTLYQTAINYSTKAYSYNESAYSNLGNIQTRCIGTNQYNDYSGSKAANGAMVWEASPDNTDCQLNTVSTHLNDGMNAGGLSGDQADLFLNALNRTGVVSVNGVKTVKNKGKTYLAFDAAITPKKVSNGLYWGLQELSTAFQATGLDSGKLPYTFFGAGTEGAHIMYYVDPATLLPVYATFDSTPTLASDGSQTTPTSWSHRFIEYAFPSNVLPLTLTGNTPVSFTTWPDHN